MGGVNFADLFINLDPSKPARPLSPTAHSSTQGRSDYRRGNIIGQAEMTTNKNASVDRLTLPTDCPHEASATTQYHTMVE